MGVGIKVRVFIVIFTFFWVLAANNSQGIRHFSGSLSEKDIPDIDENKIEEVWLHCTGELIESTKGNANLINYLSEVSRKNDNVKLDRPHRIKEIIQRTIDDLPTKERYWLLECLRLEALLHNESSLTWISKFQDLFSRWSTIPRRFLKGGKHHHRHHHGGKHHGHGHSSKRNPHPLGQELNIEEASSPSPFNETPESELGPEPASSPASSPYTMLSIHNDVNPPKARGPASSPSILLSQLDVVNPPQPLSLERAPSPAPVKGDHPSPTSSPPSPTPSPPPPTASPPSPVSKPTIAPSPVQGPPKGGTTNRSSPPKAIENPSPPPDSKPTIEAPPVETPPPKRGTDHSPPKAIANPPPSRAKKEAVGDIPSGSKHKNEHNIIIVSVIVGLASLLGLALLFICILMNRRKSSDLAEGQSEEGKDEKPLLHFCSSDVSAASSQKSRLMGKSGKNISKKSSTVGNLSAESNTQNSLQLEIQTSEAATGNNGSLLPLPPGKSAPPPPAAPSTPPPPPPKPAAPRAPAPPPPKMARPPPNPPKNGKAPSPLGPHHRGKSSLDEESKSGDPDAQKTKLKPFFWDKVQANPDHSMVWHEIREGSFQFNEEMMESLFGYVQTDKAKNENKKDSSNAQSPPKQIRIIEAKKAQNLAILLKALNVTTEEVAEALKEGNELPLELIQTLLKMAPTTDEELKLRLYSGDISLLGPAERFLKVIVDIPFAYKRFEALSFTCSLQEEVASVVESFNTLEVACKELRNSRLFLKLLEAVLKTGNRMNVGTYRGGAQAFKLDTLLKLSDVKGTDGKTTLLLFVVQEIIRSEGIRAARRLRESQSMSNFKPEDLSEDSTLETEECHRKLGLEVVSGLSSELEDVKKAAVLDGEVITGTVSKLGHSLLKIKDFLNNELKTVDDAGELCDKLGAFLEKAEADIKKLIEEDKRIMELVKNTGDYFHGNSGKDEGLRLFTIVRDFLVMLDKVCREVKSSAKWSSKPCAKKESVSETPQESHNDDPLKNDSVSDSPQESHNDDSLKKDSVSESAQESHNDFLKKDTVSESPRESHYDSLNEARLKLFPAIKERRIDDDDDYSSSDDEKSSP